VQSFYEEFVRVGVDGGFHGSVVTGPNGNPNVPSGVAVGGNVGAFATGFTNAPSPGTFTQMLGEFTSFAAATLR